MRSQRGYDCAEPMSRDCACEYCPTQEQIAIGVAEVDARRSIRQTSRHYEGATPDRCKTDRETYQTEPARDELVDHRIL